MYFFSLLHQSSFCFFLSQIYHKYLIENSDDDGLTLLIYISKFCKCELNICIYIQIYQ